jgi:uncharacterized protein (TIGR02284 family)
MIGNNDHDVTVLNTLITTTIDSANGFEESAKDVKNPQFQTLFTDYARERRQNVERLQQQVRALGGTPEDDGSMKAAAHRTFLNLKETVMGGDDKKVIEEVERGEDYIKAKYETALKDDGLSAPTRAIIQEAFTSVKTGHDRASQLKHSMQGATTA